MDKPQIQMLEATPEHFQLLMNAASDEEAKTRQLIQDKETEAIRNMSPEEIADYLADHLTQTDIIIESLRLIRNYTAGEAVYVAAVSRMRHGIESAIDWMEKHFSLTENEANEGEISNKKESPKSNKEGKRIVYGAGKNQYQEDDSELL